MEYPRDIGMFNQAVSVAKSWIKSWLDAQDQVMEIWLENKCPEEFKVKLQAAFKKASSLLEQFKLCNAYGTICLARAIKQIILSNIMKRSADSIERIRSSMHLLALADLFCI